MGQQRSKPALTTTRAEQHSRQGTSLDQVVPGSVTNRASVRLGHAHDASHYLPAPQAVVTPERANDIAGIVRAAAQHGVSVALRSGGTSLSDPAGTDGLLLDTRRHIRDIEVLDDGARVRVQPGPTVRQVNNGPRPYCRTSAPTQTEKAPTPSEGLSPVTPAACSALPAPTPIGRLSPRSSC